MISVLKFSDYRHYLKAYIAEQADLDKSWSTVRFSKKCGFNSQSAFRMVLTGKRNLTWGQICRIIGVIKLDPTESHFFESLVWLNQSRESHLRTFFQRRLNSLLQDKKPLRSRRLSSMPHASDWRLCAFILLCNGKTLEQIQNKSDELNLTEDQARSWLNDLVKKGFLIQENATYRVPEKHLIAFDPKDLRNFQRDFLLQNVAISQKLSEQLYDKGMKLYSHAVESPNLEILQQEVLDSLTRITNAAHTDELTEKKIYQINIQLFQVSNPVTR